MNGELVRRMALVFLVGATGAAVAWLGWDFVAYLGRVHWAFLLTTLVFLVCIVFARQPVGKATLSAVLRRSRP